MNKNLILCAFVALSIVSCTGKNEPSQSHQVVFHVPGLTIETQAMDGPRKVAPLTDDDGAQMSDLYIFDGATQIAHQTNEDAEFGTVTVLLTTGEHHLHFIASRSSELSYDEGILSFTSLRPTFGKHYDINVTGGSEENISLDRITGQVVITIEDEIPAGAKKLRIQFADYFKGINPTTFAATINEGFDQKIDIASSVGVSGKSWTLNILVPEYGVEHETTFALTATNGSDEVIGQAIGVLPCNSNTKTLLHGELFTGTSSIVALTTAWNADEDVTF